MGIPRLLTDVDGDEVSLVKRAANRRRFLLAKEDEMAEGLDPELADMLSVPHPREGSILDEVRKEGVDESVEKAIVASMRLLGGVVDDLAPETIAKLGSELYARQNPALNTSDAGEADGDMDGAADGFELADTEPDEDDLSKDGGKPYGNVSYADPGYQSDGKSRYPIDTEEHVRAAWSYINKPGNAAKYPAGKAAQVKARIRAAMKRLGADVSKESTEEEGGTVETHPGPVQKEDGTWDLTGVPDETRPFFEAMLQKADETAAELESTKEKLQKAEEQGESLADTLRQQEFIAKAQDEYGKVGATDEVASILKAASEAFDEETFAKLETILKAANERIEAGDLFAELGRASRGESAPTSAYSEAVAKADELVEKSGELTREQALGKVWESNPDLYAKYMAETGRAVS